MIQLTGLDSGESWEGALDRDCVLVAQTSIQKTVVICEALDIHRIVALVSYLDSRDRLKWEEISGSHGNIGYSVSLPLASKQSGITISVEHSESLRTDLLRIDVFETYVTTYHPQEIISRLLDRLYKRHGNGERRISVSFISNHDKEIDALAATNVLQVLLDLAKK